MQSRLRFHDEAPFFPEWKEDTLLIFDRRLSRVPAAAAWLRRFERRYAVTAGEELKDLEAFPRHVAAISKLAAGLASRRMTIIVAGGGSVGDFGGFVASVYKRGVRLVHVPTTWLAALDSAHGGKTALNVAGTKNQIGTIYPAAEVHVVRAFLAGLGPERAAEGAGEVLKIALLTGCRLPRFAKTDLARLPDWLWQALKPAIKGKMSIVAKDPLEKTGIRHLLNLGHTVGHAFEVAVPLPHGLAVAYGTAFAAAFSRAEKICSDKAYERVIGHPLWSLYLPSQLYVRCLSVPEARLRRALLADKKRTRGDFVRFIFLRDIGQPEIREVPVERILGEVRRQRDRLRELYG